MVLRYRFWLPGGVVFILALSFLGCPAAKPAVPVSGKLLNNGNPYTLQLQGLPPGDPGIRLGFHKQGDGDAPPEIVYALIQPSEGTFTLPGRGLAPGKYKISLSVGAMGKPDQFQGAFSEAKTPFLVEITGPSEVVIDVGTKKATVQ
jgi:hypothetical protein